MVISANNKGSLVLTRLFSETTYNFYFRTSFQVSSNILTSFIQAVILPPPENETLKYPPKLDLKFL